MGFLRLPCVKSTTINSYFNDANYGTNPIQEIYSNLRVIEKENSRILLQFSLSSLSALIADNKIDLLSNSTTANLKLYNVYSNELPPESVVYNFHTLTEQWEEGLGYDVSSSGQANWNYRDSVNLWSTSGGTFNSTPFASLSSTIPESDLVVDIAPTLSSWLTGSNNGVIVKLSDFYESSTSNFNIKKIYGRLTNTILYPTIEISWNDKFTDDINFLYFGSTANVYFYNKLKGKYSDIDSSNNFPGYLSLTGNGVDTSQTGSASSLTSIILSGITGQRIDTGIYKFNIPTISYTAASLSSFKAVWTITSSLSAVKEKISKDITINSPLENNDIDFTTNFQIAISQFQNDVKFGDILKYNLFVKRKTVALETLTASSTAINSYIISDGYFKIVDERTGLDVIPFDYLSYNDSMNYFTIDTNLLIPERPYRIVFKFVEDSNNYIFDSPDYYYIFYLRN